MCELPLHLEIGNKYILAQQPGSPALTSHGQGLNMAHNSSKVRRCMVMSSFKLVQGNMTQRKPNCRRDKVGPEVACLNITVAGLVGEVLMVQEAGVQAHQPAALPGDTKHSAPRCIWHCCKVNSHIRCTIQGRMQFTVLRLPHKTDLPG